MIKKILKESFYDGQVVRLTLNAPKGNVLDSEMMSQLQLALEGLRGQNHLKLVQFMGEGDHFSFGASVEEHTRDRVIGMLKQFHQLFYTLIDLSIPTAALVSGQCLGGGMELAIYCNFVFADKSAMFGQPEIKLGVFPPLSSLLLPLKIGSGQADSLLLTGVSISASDAQAIGLVNKVFDDKETLDSGIKEWLEEEILPKSATALRFGVKTTRHHFNKIIKKELPRLEKLYINELMATHDANEGIEAFLKKRKPEWTDR